MTDAGGLGTALQEALNDTGTHIPNGLMLEKRRCFAKGGGTNHLEVGGGCGVCLELIHMALQLGAACFRHFIIFRSPDSPAR